MPSECRLIICRYSNTIAEARNGGGFSKISL